MAKYIVNKGFKLDGKKAGEVVEITCKEAATALLKSKIIKTKR